MDSLNSKKQLELFDDLVEVIPEALAKLTVRNCDSGFPDDVLCLIVRYLVFDFRFDPSKTDECFVIDGFGNRTVSFKRGSKFERNDYGDYPKCLCTPGIICKVNEGPRSMDSESEFVRKVICEVSFKIDRCARDCALQLGFVYAGRNRDTDSTEDWECPNHYNGIWLHRNGYLYMGDKEYVTMRERPLCMGDPWVTQVRPAHIGAELCEGDTVEMTLFNDGKVSVRNSSNPYVISEGEWQYAPTSEVMVFAAVSGDGEFSVSIV